MDEQTNKSLQELKENIQQARIKVLATKTIGELKKIKEELQTLQQVVDKNFKGQQPDNSKLENIQLKGFQNLAQQLNKLEQAVVEKLDKLDKAPPPEIELTSLTREMEGLKRETVKGNKDVTKAIEDLVTNIILSMAAAKDKKVEFPKEVLVKSQLEEILKQLKEFKFPTEADNPISVRLSNGKQFYEVMQQLISRGGGTGGLVFSNAEGRPKYAVVDENGHILISGTITPSKSSTATTTQVADTASNITLLVANTSRLGASVVNNSSSTLFLKCGADATTSDFTVKMYQDEYWECPANYTGRIDGIWSTNSSGSAAITEYT